jgi:hypothetical protein
VSVPVSSAVSPGPAGLFLLGLAPSGFRLAAACLLPLGPALVAAARAGLHLRLPSGTAPRCGREALR